MMGVIFTASTGAGTSAHSGRIVAAVLSWIGAARRLTPEQLDLVNHYARKAAHVTEYALLAALLHRAIARGAAAARARWSILACLEVIGIVALYAASDEFHQRFVPTRTPSVWDVLLDTSGGSVGLLIKWGWEQSTTVA